jgi:hypothetical protein
MLCKGCNSVLNSSDTECPTCGLPSVGDQVAKESPALPDPRPAQNWPSVQGAPQLPSSLPRGPIPFKLGIDERIWRAYQVSRLPRDRGVGVLYVTDSRLVFHAQAKGRGTLRPSSLIQQTKLEDITGVQAYVSRRISLLLAVLTVVFTITGLATLVILVGVVFLVLAAVCVVFLVRGAAKKGAVGVQIASRATQTSPVEFGAFTTQRGFIANLLNTLWRPLLSLFGVFSAVDVLLGLPGEHSEEVVNELGALILDLQTRGDLAAAHWQVPISGQ